MAGDGELRANWNKALVEELAASCYTRVLIAAKAALGGGEAYEALWPTGRTTEGGMWRGLADSLMRLAKPLPLLQTRSKEKGGWVTPQRCVVWAAGGVGDDRGGGRGGARGGGEGGDGESDEGQEQRALAEVLLAEKVGGVVGFSFHSRAFWALCVVCLSVCLPMPRLLLDGVLAFLCLKTDGVGS